MNQRLTEVQAFLESHPGYLKRGVANIACSSSYMYGPCCVFIWYNIQFGIEPETLLFFISIFIMLT